MASATNISISQICATTINNAPYLIALGEGGGVYALNLNVTIGKGGINTTWQQLPPIYVPNGYSYPLVKSGGDTLPNVSPLIYQTTSS